MLRHMYCKACRWMWMQSMDKEFECIACGKKDGFVIERQPVEKVPGVSLGGPDDNPQEGNRLSGDERSHPVY